MSVYIISDLHIRGAEDPVYRSLLGLLDSRLQSGDTFVMAGDVFDLFVGGKSVFIRRYSEFFDALRRAGSAGASIHYIEGNHDFLLRRAFTQIPGVELHTRDFSIQVNGKKFFFSHGDTVNRSDYGYLALRFLIRSPVLRFLIRVVPGSWVDAIGCWSSSRSRMFTQSEFKPNEKLRNIYRSFAAERLAEGHDFVVMGHCHDLDEMTFRIGDRPGQYVNVGFPRVHGSFLSWSPGDEKIQRERLPS